MVPLRVRRDSHDASVEQIAFPQTKLVIVTSGWTRLIHRERAVTLSPGDVAILPSRALVSGEPLSFVETVTLYIDPAFMQQQLSWVNLSPSMASALRAATEGTGPLLNFTPTRAERSTIVSHAQMLAEHDRATVRGFGLLSSSLNFLDRITRLVDPTSGVLPRRELRKIMAAFQSDLSRRWTVGELSRMVNLSNSQLARVFNATLGAPPMQVLARLRVDRLAELLITTDWTVQRCGEAVGWFDPCYATRIMKRVYGITPSEYRRTARSRMDARF